VNTITLACYRQSSPYLPLIACAMVRYSLSNGVLEESATAFVVYGFFLVYLKNDFDEARRWAEIAEKILDPQSPFTHCEWNWNLYIMNVCYHHQHLTFPFTSTCSDSVRLPHFSFQAASRDSFCSSPSLPMWNESR